MGRIGCPCGNSMHDDTTEVARIMPVDPQTRELPNSLEQQIYRMAVDCWEGRRKPAMFASDIVGLFEEYSTRVHKCDDCGRLCWDVEVDAATEKYELVWFKPEAVEAY